jgi:hypothetical protein
VCDQVFGRDPGYCHLRLVARRLALKHELICDSRFVRMSKTSCNLEILAILQFVSGFENPDDGIWRLPGRSGPCDPTFNYVPVHFQFIPRKNLNAAINNNYDRTTHRHRGCRLRASEVTTDASCSRAVTTTAEEEKVSWTGPANSLPATGQ